MAEPFTGSMLAALCSHWGLLQHFYEHILWSRHPPCAIATVWCGELYGKIGHNIDGSENIRTICGLLDKVRLGSKVSITFEQKPGWTFQEACIVAKCPLFKTSNIISPANHFQPIIISSYTDVCCVEVFSPHVSHVCVISICVRKN